MFAKCFCAIIWIRSQRCSCASQRNDSSRYFFRRNSPARKWVAWNYLNQLQYIRDNPWEQDSRIYLWLYENTYYLYFVYVIYNYFLVLCICKISKLMFSAQTTLVPWQLWASLRASCPVNATKLQSTKLEMWATAVLTLGNNTLWVVRFHIYKLNWNSLNLLISTAMRHIFLKLNRY